jgi:splicing factor U2AF subunit
MAIRLARIYGTEMDKVNCPFYIKMGACRYGDSCERIHNKPPISETVMLVHMYENSPIETALTMGSSVSKDDAETALSKFEFFYEDVFK